MFDYQGRSNFVGLKSDTFPYLIKQAFANYASSLVKGKDLDLSVTSLNNLVLSPNSGVKLFDSYG